MLEEVLVSPERKRQVQLLLLHSEHGAAEATRGVPGEGRARPGTTPQGMQGEGHPRSLQRRRAELQGQHSHRLHAASLAPGSGQLSAHKLDAPPRRFYLSVFALGLCDHIREHTVQLQEAAVVREVTRIGRAVPKAKRGSHAASSTA